MTFAIEPDLNPRQRDFRGDYGRSIDSKEKNSENKVKNSIQSLRAVFVGISQS